jgi:hypothetical protein
MFLTLLGASAAAAGRTGVATVALGLATAAAGTVPATGSGAAGLGLSASATAVTTTRAAGAAALGLGATGTARVRVAGTGSCALGVGTAAVGQLPIRATGAASLGVGTAARGGRVIAVRIVDRSGVRLLAVDVGATLVTVSRSVGTPVMPLLTEASVPLLTEDGELLELESSGLPAATSLERLSMSEMTAPRAVVTRDASVPRLTVREAPPIPSAAR